MTPPALFALCTGVFAILFVLLSGLKGCGAGFFRSSTRLLGTLLALLLSLRLWYLCTAAVPSMVPIPADLVAGLFFWVLFALGWVAFTALPEKLPDQSIPSYHPWLERIGGFVCGGFSGAILYLVILLGLYPALPRLPASFDTGKITSILENGPLALYQKVESRVTGLPDGNPARTPLPRLQATGEGRQPVWN